MSLKQSHKRILAGVGVAIILVILAFVTIFFNWSETSVKKSLSLTPPEPFTTTHVKAESVPIWYSAVGAIGSEKKAMVSAQVPGVVSAFKVELGDFVPQGTVVVQLKAEELEARKAKVASELLGAESQQDIAQSHFDRTSELYQHDAATLEQYEQAKQRLSDAKALVDATKEMLREAEINLGYRNVEAPFDGIIAERFVDPGDFVWVGKALFSLYDPAKARIEVMIPERYMGKLKVGLETEVDVKAIGKVLKAKVSEIRPHVDPNTRSFVVKSDFIEGGDDLYTGMFGTLRFQTGERNILLIPKEAPISMGQLHLVWTMTDDGWQKRYVTLGKEFEDGQVEVLSGLSPNEQIAIVGKLQRE